MILKTSALESYYNSYYDAFIVPVAHTVANLADVNGYDCARKAWVKNGRYERCGHPDTMLCGCYGQEHMGEPIREESLPDILPLPK
jgi:hypothetical protein